MTPPFDHIFIDTCILRSSGFFKKGGQIYRLFDLAEKGYVRILMPAITEQEWLKHYTENSRLQFPNIERKALSFGKELPEYFLKRYAAIIGEYDDIVRSSFEYHLHRANVIKLPIDYSNDQLTDIFDSYFSNKKPFGSADKKHEFPDAFVLSSLEKFAEENNIDKIILLSSDKDMTEYQSDRLLPINPTDYLNSLTTDVIPKYEKSLKDEQVQKIADDVISLSTYVSGSPSYLMKAVKERLEEFLSDPWNYSERFDYVDIENADIKDLRLDPDVKSLQILSIEKERIEASFDIDVDAVVEVEHFDIDHSVWDSEEKEFLFKENTTTDLEISSKVTVTINFSPEDDNDDFDDTEIEDIDLSRLEEDINDRHCM